jgi:hypothetical protein
VEVKTADEDDRAEFELELPELEARLEREEAEDEREGARRWCSSIDERGEESEVVVRRTPLSATPDTNLGPTPANIVRAGAHDGSEFEPISFNLYQLFSMRRRNKNI